MLPDFVTREIIEKLETYEKIHEVGAATGISTVCNGDRTVEENQNRMTINE